MRLRPIHLTSLNRIRELNRHYDISLPAALLGQVLFELSALNTQETEAFGRLFEPSVPALVKIDRAEGRVLLNPLFCSFHKWPADIPSTVKEACLRMTAFLQGPSPTRWEWGNKRLLDFGNGPIIMGILNVTPDSFSDGGQFNSMEKALRHALQMVEEGAQIIDVGGESTRPGALPVSEQEETARVVPIIAAIRARSNVLISVDTYKSKVAARALQAGADLVNDISGAQFDPEMISVVQKARCPLIVMHIKGTPRNMQKNPFYTDVVGEVYRYFEERLQVLTRAGIEMVALDPGIGFGKRLSDNLQLLRDLKDFTFLNRPILIGTSRKSFIGAVLNKETDQRLFGSLATELMAVHNGAHIVRVHDVAATKDVLQMQRAVFNGDWPEATA